MVLVIQPKEITARISEIAKAKASLPWVSALVLAFLAGAFIAFAAGGSTLVAHDSPSFGLGRLLTGAVFATGLMLVVMAGGELFTGNSLMVVGLLDRAIRPRDLLRNWSLVYVGNFAGSLFVAFLMGWSGLWRLNGGKVGASVISIAASKVSLDFGQAFVRGILCNWLVCLAVWMAAGALSAAGKAVAIFFPIMLFVASGFEHSVANMYYVPAGILAMGDPAISALAAGPASSLTWGSFFWKNLLPVTLGNIVGGVIFVGTLYWIAFVYGPSRSRNQIRG
ncbi:MAG: formate/nitrite transporter family protein [Firmicutes bacterium]|nr:formate/nitrite transporter family protein [Candidatus Fermentithermobacillaceae bacterium]